MASGEHITPVDLSEAERAFESFLRARGQDGDGELELLCASRPELEAELREIHADYQRGQDLLARLGSRAGEEPPAATARESRELRAGMDELARLSHTAGYRRLGAFAHGGMGEVVEVWDAKLRRTLAMKLLACESGEAAASDSTRLRRMGRFLQEARVTGRLDHPGVVPVHDLGLDGEGRLFFTMPLVQGRTFTEVIGLVRAGEEGWTLARALGVVVQVCEATAYAHSKGVIHRDLKPSNVMVGLFGQTYVMDWGLARVTGLAAEEGGRPREPAAEPRQQEPTGDDSSDSPFTTLDGTVLGTPAYMAPEQAWGRAGEIGPRSDVYSVGAILYHLLTGRVPYCGTVGEDSAWKVLRRVRAGPPRPIERPEGDVPAELVAICNKAMAREPARRYAGPMEMAADLRAFLEGRVVRAHETGAAAELRKWVKRNRGTAAALLGAALVAVAGFSGVLLVQAGGKRELGRTVERLEATNESLRRSSYFNNISLAHGAYESLNTSDLKALLADCDEELRGWEWRYLQRMSDTSARTFRGHLLSIPGLDFSPDGRRIVSAGRDGLVAVWDAREGGPLMSFCGHEDLVETVAWSPDGTRIASGARDGLVKIWDAATGEELARLAHAGVVWNVAFAPDGRRLVAGGADHAATIWDVETGVRLARMVGHESDVQTAVFSPDGERVATASLDGTVRAWDATSGQLELVLWGPERSFLFVEFSPDGEWLVAGGGHKVNYLWDARTGELVRRFVSDRTGTTAFDIDSSGRYLATCEFGTIRLWDLTTGDRLRRFCGHNGPVSDLSFARQGRWLASCSADRTIRVWDIEDDPEVRSFAGHTGFIGCVAFSPGGREIASGGRDGTLRLWSVETGAEVAGWPANQPWVTALAFSPDGERLVSGGWELRVWMRRSGELAREWKGHDGFVTRLAFSADGALFASAGSDGSARVWDAASWAELAAFQHPDHVRCARFSPDGALLVTACKDGFLRIWDIGQRELVQALEAPDFDLAAAAFAPDGGRIASCGEGSHVSVWSFPECTLRFDVKGHEKAALDVAWTPDGERLVSVGYEGFVKIWDGRTGKLALSLQRDAHPLGCVALSPDGERIAAGGVAMEVLVWEATRGTVIR